MTLQKDDSKCKVEVIPGVEAENMERIIAWTNARGAEFLMQWTGPKWHFPLTLEQMEEEDGMYSVMCDGRFAGMMQEMSRVDGNVHIGRIMIDPDQMGHGIGTRAVKQFTQMIFQDKDIHTISLSVYTYNQAAIKCYQKCGFSVMKKMLYDNRQDCYRMILERAVSLDMNQYKRLDHFRYFKSLAFPYVGTTSDVDITDFFKWIKSNNYPFFLSFLWCAARAANEVREFRQRIVGEQIIEYPFCKTSHTVAKEDETYSYCTLDERMDFESFLEYASTQQDKARQEGTIEEDGEAALSYLFISTVPWMTYISLIQPVSIPADSNPRITWGKYYERDGRKYMPVSVLCHHALVDGKHIAKFYEKLEEEMQKQQV